MQVNKLNISIFSVQVFKCLILFLFKKYLFLFSIVMINYLLFINSFKTHFSSYINPFGET